MGVTEAGEPGAGMLPKAGRTSFDYDQEMRLTAVTDAAGAKTDIGHDALGRITEIRQPLDAGTGSAPITAPDGRGRPSVRPPSPTARGGLLRRRLLTAAVFDGLPVVQDTFPWRRHRRVPTMTRLSRLAQ
jgi:YD repeat-containing protein